MGAFTYIQWCRRTFNSWRGCKKISSGCAHCYAAAGAPRNPKVLGKWGGEESGTRIVAAEAGWKAVHKWDREAKESGTYDRVFCGSWMDICEEWHGPMLDAKKEVIRINEELGYWSTSPNAKGLKFDRDLTMDDVRERLFIDSIAVTPNLDWLLVTKRPERYRYVLPWLTQHAGQYRDRYWENVWVGTTVEDRAAKTRIDILREIPAVIRFLSVEPLLEDLGELNLTGIHWVIVGGESGPKARPCNLAWIRSVMRQCKDAGVPAFCKQLGSHVITRNDELGEWPEPFGHHESERYQGAPVRVRVSDSHGGDPAEWPEDLRVREMPRTR